MGPHVICVQPIDADVASEALESTFSFHGKIERLALVPSERCCFIQFASDAAVRSALMLDRTLLPCATQKVDVAAIPEDQVPDASFWRTFAVPLHSSDSSDEFEKIELPENSSAAPESAAPSSSSANDADETARLAMRSEALCALQKQPINRVSALLGVALAVELTLIAICS